MFKQKPQSPNKKTSLKAGVSLITVLLFMMIATIAATATYKWITSEGRSSASRMLQREAYQSAVAGIENARAWMTYHANDVGGLVTQYFQNEKKPILLDTVLKPFTNEKQDYNVWLTGVNTQGNTYKLKLLSSGKSRNGTVHNEVAILNVSGLYQVLVPQTKDTGTIDFEYAYFGGGFKSTQVTITSAVVNGDWSGNPPTITKNWVVTGNAKLSGNNVYVGELACIGGNASTENQGISGKNLYVGGDFKGGINITEDVYFENDATQVSGGPFNIGSNVFLGGVLNTSLNDKPLSIHGNLCLEDDAYVWIKPVNSNNPFTVDGSIWMPGTKPLWTDSDNHGSYQKIVLGKDQNSKIYIKAGHPWSDYNKLRNDRKFKQAKDHPRACKGFDQGSIHICAQDEADFGWDDKENYVYPAKGKEDNLYYIYYMPEGVTDVGFGIYVDTYWKWCWSNNITQNYYGQQRCSSYDQKGTEINSYFVNFSEKNEDTRFTTSNNSATSCSDSMQPIKNGSKCYRYLNHNGETPTASPYCNLKGEKNWTPECGVKPWFRVNGAFQENFPAEKPEDLACAEQVKTDCDSIWVEEPGCDGAKYKVKDPLVTAKDQFESFASKGCAANITEWRGNLVDKLNACYKENMADSVKKKEDLYNGFLVVKLTSVDNNGVSGRLDGKFIILVTEKINAQNGLPGTTDETSVFLYLEKGATYIQREAKNYFIFTEGDIGESSGLNLTGTIYAPTNSCANANFKDSKLTHNNELLRELTEAGVICNNDGSPCGGSSADTESSLGGVDLGDYILSGRDVFYVATAPQLGITLESQYETREKEPEVTADAGIDPSILILPRVSYLTTDAIGKLSDYYNVINLNGADEVKDPSAVMCTPTGLNTTSALYDGTTPIKEGVYTCVYQSSKGYGTVPFYVVVYGKSGDAPTVAFTTENQEVLKGGAVDVYLKIPESTRPNPINVDLIASEIPEGWTLNPTSAVSLRDNSSGTAVYTVTAQPASGNATEVHIFTVSLENNAVNGSVLFQLVAPCDGCVIGMPSSQTVFATGYANINRLGLTEYCSAFPDACDSDDLEAAQRPDCDVSAEWVRAVGMNCRVEEVNNRWTCGTNQAVSLQSLTLPNYCELFMPSENNTHSVLEDGKDYTLYASLKKKPYTLTVKIDGADESTTSVTITTDSKTETCLQTDDACDFIVYAGENVSITYSAETDKFSYWKCSGDNCPVELSTSSVYSLQPISGNNTVTAKFNDKDKHCFYEDFSNLTAFCDNNEHCIRDCSEPSGCIVSGTTTVDWQLMQKDGSNTPAISSGFITTPAMNKGKQTFIMSTKQAGANGQMTSMLQTAVVREADRAEMYNSGFVVRSNTNASSYLLLNVYGVGEGSYGTLTTRLCKGEGLTSVTSCTEKRLMNGSSTAEISATTMINMSLTADKDTILVEARVNGSLYVAKYDISSFNMTSQEYQYVGFKLSDETTKLYDIAWRSSDYADDCWSVPTVDCSFKANYLGGLVPKDSNVTPWVGASSWFTDHSCEYKYYYNGNDNVTTTAGTVDGLGSALASKDYNFSEEGLHGPESKDAKVSVECPDNTTSLNGQNTSCGNFWVGKQMACSQNYEILNEVVGISDAESEFPVSVSGANLREAVLKFTVSDLPDGEKITVYLKDVDGSLSLPGTIKANGNQEISIESILNKDNFNPQKVVAVLMSATTVANVSTIYSDCPYAFAITGCSASYNGSSWVVSATFKNIEGAETNGCSIVPSTSDIDATNVTGVSCPDVGNFTLPDSGLYTRVNQGVSGIGYSFTVKAIAKDGAELTCVTDEVVIEPTEITCSVTPEQVVEGAGMPILQMSIANAPIGTPYTLKFNGTQFDNGEYRGGGVQYTHSYGEANTAETPLALGTYSYVIEALGKTKECGFEVVEAIDAEASCSVSGNTLSVTVTGANYGDAVPVKVGISDVIGNVLGFESISMNQNTTKEIDLSTYNNQLTAGTSYPVTLTLNGNGQSCGNYTPPLPELTLQCPANLTGKNVSEPVTITPTVEGCNVVGGCEWTITPATEGGSGTGYTSGSMSFTNTNGSGTVSHTINITRPKDNATKSCSFDVGFIEGSGSVTADCWFANQSHNWGDNGCFKFKTNRPSSAYVIKDIYGNSVGSGTTNGDTNQENQLCFTIRDGSNYSLFIDGSFACDKSPNVPAMKASNCRVDQTSLPPTGTTKFRADLTSCNSSACTYYLKKDGVTIKNATYGSNIEPDITGPGTYTLHLLSEDATSACSVTITEVSPATNCQFANATYTYGEDAYFKTKVTASNASWSIRDPNGNVVHSGSGLSQNNQDWQTNFKAKIGGEYTFYLNDQKACTANLNLNMPKATNCRFDNSNINSGANTEFRFKIEYCKNSLCSYVVKLGSTTIDSQNNTGEGDRNKNVNMAGEYVVWLNGVETDCKATLTVGGNSTTPEPDAPGTYDKTIPTSNSNATIQGMFVGGTYYFNTGKKCSRAQLHASGTGTVVINSSSSWNCGYRDDNITAESTITLNVPESCTVTKLYVSNCN